MTTGAPHRWVTPSRAIASSSTAGSTPAQEHVVPAIAVMVHGKHQPLQWNIGKVHQDAEFARGPVQEIEAHCDESVGRARRETRHEDLDKKPRRDDTW